METVRVPATGAPVSCSRRRRGEQARSAFEFWMQLRRR